MTSTRPVTFRWSLLLGLAYAVILAVIAALGLPDTDGTFSGLGYPEIAVLYISGGILGGCLFWALQGIRGSTAGRMVLGFACLLPIMSLAVLVVPDDDLTVQARIFGALMAAALVGGGIGLNVRDL